MHAGSETIFDRELDGRNHNLIESDDVLRVLRERRMVVASSTRIAASASRWSAEGSCGGVTADTRALGV
jgi:hypothetical protein